MKNVRNTYSFRRYATQNSATTLRLRPRRVADTLSDLPRHQLPRCLSAVTSYGDRPNITYVPSNSFAVHTTSRRRESWCGGLSLSLATNFARFAGASKPEMGSIRKNRYFNHIGYSLVEVIVYASVLVLVLGVIINSVVSLVNTDRHYESSRRIQADALSAMSRILSDARQSLFINDAESVFGSDNGVLSLTLLGDAQTPETVRYYLDGNNVYRYSASGSGYVTSSTTRAVGLRFQNISTGRSRAVRVQLSLEAGEGGYVKSSVFYDSALLRGSYANL